MRQLKTLIAPAFLLLLCTTARADRINVRVNGELVQFEGTQPRQYNGRVMVPLRGVLEQLGATVDWLAREQTVVATRGDMEINLPIGSRYATVNGRQMTLDAPAMTIAGSTMVPLRFVSEALGAEVTWSGATQTVMIDTDRTYRAYRRPRTETRANYARMYIAAGSVVPLRLDSSLRSNTSAEGDYFTATVQDGPDDGGLPAGTKLEGVVREAIPARSGKPGVLDVDFVKVLLPEGTEIPIDASVISLDNKSTMRNESGRLVAKSRQGEERMKWVGIGAGAGLLIGALTKGNVLVDTILGAGAGYLFNEVQRHGAGDVNLRPGTELVVRLDRRFAFDVENP